MKWFKRVFIGLIITVFILFLSGFLYLRNNTYESNYSDDQFLENSIFSNNTRIFESSGPATANIVFYPGGLVERDAYAYLAYLLSLEGFNVFLVGMPLNLAILGINKIEDIMVEFPSTLPWYIGGHSLGGASASIYSAQNHQIITGLFFLGAYPSSNSDLSDTSLKVISITAENDLILNQETYIETQVLLPNRTVYLLIEGGNHSYFGFYGEQKNDGVATITRALQHQKTVEALTDWINS